MRLGLVRERSEIAEDREESYDGEGGIEQVAGGAWGGKGFAYGLPDDVDEAVEGGGWKGEHGEGIEAEGVAELTVEQSGEGSGGSAAGALEVEEELDGALRIEGDAGGREATEQKSGEDRCRGEGEEGCDGAGEVWTRDGMGEAQR